MRTFLIVLVSTVGSWLAVSVVLALVYSFVFNPVAAVVLASGQSGPSAYTTYSALNGLLILALTIALAVPLYRGLQRRWGAPAQPVAWGSAPQATSRDDSGASLSATPQSPRAEQPAPTYQ